MATIRSRYKSLQKSYSSFSGGLSGYAKTVQNRVQAAEDKVVDQNYQGGSITTERYLEELRTRTARLTLTPVQRVTINKQIQDVASKYEDEQIQTA